MTKLRVAALSVALAGLGCEKQPDGPVCGLLAASAPVTLKTSEGPRVLSVGARLNPSDKIEAKQYAVLECFGGALKILDGEKAEVGKLKESRIESFTLAPHVLKDGKAVAIEGMHRPIAARFTDTRFTPVGSANAAAAATEPTTGDYMRAFFAPNGMADFTASAGAADGPRNLPPPAFRPKVPFIHGGDLGEGGATLKVTDDVVFAETDDLATAALLDGHTYQLGRTVRLMLPDGAEAELTLPGAAKAVDLDGPMDLRLK